MCGHRISNRASKKLLPYIRHAVDAKSSFPTKGRCTVSPTISWSLSFLYRSVAGKRERKEASFVVTSARVRDDEVRRASSRNQATCGSRIELRYIMHAVCIYTVNYTSKLNVLGINKKYDLAKCWLKNSFQFSGKSYIENELFMDQLIGITDRDPVPFSGTALSATVEN